MPRALLSVSDKTGLEAFAQGLVALGYDLVASGGTAHALAAAGLTVTEISDLTGSPEILGGRVKTLHPAVHGGILARPTAADRAELEAHGIGAIDLVACNLYAFRETVADRTSSESEIIEKIDIGGVTLLRAAAKSFARVVVVCDPSTYDDTLEGLRTESLDLAARRSLAMAAFRHTAAYDVAIANWFGHQIEGEQALPSWIGLTATREASLRYGENAHQAGALYRPEGTPSSFIQIGGEKELSYNNIADANAAWSMASELERPLAVIVKHLNPCGMAVADDLLTAFERALACDPVSAFGGILAVNRPVDLALVEAFGPLFLEVIIAPAFTPEALERLAAKKKNCRLLQHTGHQGAPKRLISAVEGGLLVQSPDPVGVGHDTWTLVSQRAPTDAEARDLAFAEIVAKHVKSNAIVLVKDEATVGVGAGQMNRVDSVRIAAWRAGERAKGAVLASDAFFPFADGVREAVEAGVTAALHPGGSVRDAEVFAAADALGIAMVVTGVRHFRH